MNCLSCPRPARTTLLFLTLAIGCAAEAQTSSYMPVNGEEPFDAVQRRMEQAKPAIMQSHQDFLAERYDLTDRPASTRP